MTHDDARDARQVILETARAMLSGELDLVNGARRLCELRHEISATESELFCAIIGFESETDDYPVGDARQRFDQEYLRKLDEEICPYLEEARPGVIAACEKIIEVLS